MAFVLRFLHVVRLTVLPAIYYKIREVQTSAPKHDEEGGDEGH